MVPGERIELPTFGLQNRCSTAELTRRDSADQILRLIPKCNPQGSAIELLSNGSRFAILGISQTARGRRITLGKNERDWACFLVRRRSTTMPARPAANREFG